MSTQGPRRPNPPAGRQAPAQSPDDRERVRAAAGPQSGRAGARRRAVRADAEAPSFLAMIGMVAIVVAAVIVVFFIVGYVLGRIFL